MQNRIDWENLYKIRIANSDDSFQKHEVIKLLVVMKILNKYKRKDWIRIYTEFNLGNNKKPDIYFENSRKKQIIVYEIQKEITKEWESETIKKYDKYEVAFYDYVDLVIIPIKDLSNDLTELNNQLDDYIM